MTTISKTHSKQKSDGFTAIELLIACFVFPIIVVGIATAYQAIRRSYTTARQLNEMYAVLSACPEVDRALEFNSLSSTTNCYPNNTFLIENAESTRTINYSPSLTVTDTNSLGASDPLKTVPDSKVVEIQVNFLPPAASNTPLRLRMLITRNGIGQL